ncbi:hypothetical protein SB30_190119 [Klebsiella quasipneumoniae subsp. similipneumoniae]|nr:hypothetical protein SB30_190119 [Klebsiella quasipneumoniae subsp. similipneumoniae]
MLLNTQYSTVQSQFVKNFMIDQKHRRDYPVICDLTYASSSLIAVR